MNPSDQVEGSKAPGGALAKLIVSGLGTGYLPIAPGSWGSLAVTGLFVLIAWGSGGRAICVTGSMVALALAASVGCVACGRWAEEYYGRKDPGHVTADEWAGQALTFVLLPLTVGLENLWLVAAVGFVAFRIFDIVKPPPVRAMEKLPFGWGVLLDDLVAGVYANIVCQVLLRVWLLQAGGG